MLIVGQVFLCSPSHSFSGRYLG